MKTSQSNTLVGHKRSFQDILFFILSENNGRKASYINTCYTKLIMNAWKTVLLCTLLVLVALPVFAQAPDKTPRVVFRFVEGKDMFYVPWNGNGTALDSLCQLINPAELDMGSVKVDGYSKTRKLSMIRCNRVKSELIARKGLQEEHFTTTNNAGEWNGMKNVVLITLPVLYRMEAGQQEAVPSESREIIVKDDAVTKPEIPDGDKPLQADKPVDKQTATASQEQPETTTSQRAETPQHSDSRQAGTMPAQLSSGNDAGTLSLRANLLRWATLTPGLGIEWRIDRNWSIQVNGTWTSWSWDDKNRRYALWEISPEVRYYMGTQKRGYLGAMYHVGEFNYKLSDTGKQGNLTGGGITGGYLLKLNRALSLDFSLGIGCTHAEYDRYTVIDGVNVKHGKTDKNYWGVNHAGISLIWTIF